MRDSTVCFWDLDDNFKYEKLVPSSLEYFQYRIWFVDSGMPGYDNDLWLTTDKTNVIHSWDIKNECHTCLPHVHKAQILDLQSIPSH